MASRINGSVNRPKALKHVKEMGPNWVFIVGGALLCTLSIRLCCRLKRVFDFKSSKNGNPTHNTKPESQKLHSQLYCVIPDEDGCHQCLSGANKHTPTSPTSKSGDKSLPLVKVTSDAQSYLNHESIWASPLDLLELPPNPSSHLTSSDSPRISESGSDIYSKREVIQKLRHQLKRRDEMVLEMHAQITALQNSLTVQRSHTAHLQAQLDSSNQCLVNSAREIKWLQKIIYDLCSNECVPPEHASGQPGGSIDWDLHSVGVSRLKRELRELEEVIMEKEFLIESYKEERIELCSGLKEVQVGLARPDLMPNIL